MALIQQILIERDGFGVGRFRCPPSHPHFRDTGPVGGYLLVFPRTSVGIRQAGRAPVIADPTLVMLYNDRQEYRRELVSAEGDRCEFFAFPAEAAREAIGAHDPGALDREREIFRASHCPGSPQIYLRQRRIIEQILRQGAADGLALEEQLLELLGMVVGQAYGRAAPPQGARKRRAAHELADAVKRLLADRYCQPLTLQQISAQVHCSPYHLCRAFSAVVGMPIHRYLNRLRLHAALERIADRPRDLSGLAVDLGFAHHSHFTRLFRQEFGVTPSRALGD